MSTGAAAVTPGQLAKWAGACDRAGDAAALAGALLHQGDTLQARELIDEARTLCRHMHQALADAGAPLLPATAPAQTPLHLLSTPAARRLLSALGEAVAVAEALDAERGHVLPGDFPLLPGESRGTGWAETLSNLAERLRVEVEGPRSSRGE